MLSLSEWARLVKQITAHDHKDAGKGCRKCHPFLVAMQTCTTTMEISVTVSQEAENRSTPKST